MIEVEFRNLALIVLIISATYIHDADAIYCYACNSNWNACGDNPDLNMLKYNKEPCSGPCKIWYDGSIVFRACSNDPSEWISSKLSIKFCNSDLCNINFYPLNEVFFTTAKPTENPTTTTTPTTAAKTTIKSNVTYKPAPLVSGVTTKPAPTVSGLTTKPAPIVSGLTTKPAPTVSGLTTKPAPIVSGLTTKPAPTVSGLTTKPALATTTSKLIPILSGVTTKPVIATTTTKGIPIVSGITTKSATTTKNIPIVSGITTPAPGSLTTINTGNNLVTFEQFSRAVTKAGYPAPTMEKYNNYVTQLAPNGGITTKREAAMFLAQILWESDGLQARSEYACIQTGCPGVYGTSQYPGQSYYGRGYIQLSWNYNYQAASMALYGDDRLLRDANQVATNDQIAWATAFWFWKANVGSNPAVKNGAFGSATRAINGGLECDGAYRDKARRRFEIYKIVLAEYGVNEAPIENGCYN